MFNAYKSALTDLDTSRQPVIIVLYKPKRKSQSLEQQCHKQTHQLLYIR